MVRKSKSAVLLSFDVEEFDMPREHGGSISVEEGVRVSSEGLVRVLDLLAREKVVATFFVTGNFAKNAPELVKRMVREGHEVACHGVDHFCPAETDVRESKKIVEKVAGVRVLGYRQPRMFAVDYVELSRCGYVYDSSVNPAWVPGRYNHKDVPREPFVREGVVLIPTSVFGRMRVPLFWLALHLFPLGLYCRWAVKEMRRAGYLATYFHPWEFAEVLRDYEKVPGYVKKNSGVKLIERLHAVIDALRKAGGDFTTYGEFARLPVDKK